MKQLEPLIKSEWGHFYDAVNTEEDWITPLIESVEGVGAPEAFWRPSGEVASIAEIIAHVSGHLEATLRAVLGMPDQDYSDWPETGPADQAQWQGMVERLKLTVADLHRALHNWELEEIYAIPTGRQSRRSTMLTNILVHNAYHAGQIIKLRQAFVSQREGVHA